MKVLLVHNRYQQRGGEDAVVESEGKLLSDHGVTVQFLATDNEGIVGIRGKLEASLAVLHSPASVDRIQAQIRSFRPDVVHVHNWFPTLSPSVFWACQRLGAPVVHTTHNYRLLCVKASLFRNGAPCEDCIGTSLRLPGIVHGCYRESHLGSAVATTGMLLHWARGTWHRAVDRFIALSEFARTKLIEGGLPARKLVVKPNALEWDPGCRAGAGGYFAYLGRLTEEKGLRTLLRCWRMRGDLPRLRIMGSGPLEVEVREAAAASGNIEWTEPKRGDAVLDFLGDARALICPSLWYEGMPRVVVEALATGTPVIASRIGTLAEMIHDGSSGLLFPANNADALLECIQGFLRRESPNAFRAAARQQFVAKYTAAANLRALLAIYSEVRAEKSSVARR